ncbi:putative uncharacterized protein [Pseudarthrobacter siccitolerans]|uniref:Uncharacterized protein n=2 Tax=Pseudarthrobacter siccitolerans TaxID=861266 RepID=A0A024GX93_9MICC|nr:putative uncharacterized protein [Pseudarthrobacter siccitolerans]
MGAKIMSITPSKKTGSIRAKIALVPALAFGLIGGSMALAVPAQAAYDHHDNRHGCTVKPLSPDNLRGNRVNFKIKVECDGEKTVHIRQLRYEDERGPRRSDDFLGHSHFYEKFNSRDKHDDRRVLDSVDRVRNLDRRGAEEVYHLVSFRVKDHKGNWSDWSNWKKSDVVEVHR